MRSVFLLGYPQTPTRASPGELSGKGRGAETYTQQKYSDKKNLGFSTAGISKVRSVFLLGHPQTPTRASPMELWRLGRGAETYIQQKIF